MDKGLLKKRIDRIKERAGSEAIQRSSKCYIDQGHDDINNPGHYTSHPSGIECIDIVEHCDFLTGNIIKYAFRAGLKHGATKLKDLEKCLWYARRAAKKEREKDGSDYAGGERMYDE